MSYTSVVVNICDGCGREVTTYKSTEEDNKHPNNMPEVDSAIRYWHTLYEDNISYSFCCWDCVRAYAENQIATGKNRLEDDLET